MQGARKEVHHEPVDSGVLDINTPPLGTSERRRASCPIIFLILYVVWCLRRIPCDGDVGWGEMIMPGSKETWTAENLTKGKQQQHPEANLRTLRMPTKDKRRLMLSSTRPWNKYPVGQVIESMSCQRPVVEPKLPGNASSRAHAHDGNRP